MIFLLKDCGQQVNFLKWVDGSIGGSERRAPVTIAQPQHRHHRSMGAGALTADREDAAPELNEVLLTHSAAASQSSGPAG